MNYIDLFSGIGCFALGAYWAGMKFEKHYFSEVDPYCVELYQKRFPDAIPLGDIREIDCEKLADTTSGYARSRGEQLEGKESTDRQSPQLLPDSSHGSGETETGDNNWIITGGFPCQDISVAGKGAGIEGSRSGLWAEYWRIIREIRPRYAIIENVSALTFRGLDRVLSDLAALGYDAEWQDIRAEDMGAPHRRERIWIIAYASGERGVQSAHETRQQEHGRLGNYAAPVPDTESDGRQQTGIRRQESSRASGEDSIPYSARPISEPGAGRRRIWEGYQAINGSYWTIEPGVGRLAHGVSRRVDRLKGLGNAIVPQIAELLFKQIKLDITT
ncbi:MAG: DNA (cytosine-5-)-methyltransferase [Candidatus Abyssubacteria bacterium]|nr:DNA (cytosine-5-)-methyltransferase [Candidatus Abyssubacteria bacterium]